MPVGMAGIEFTVTAKVWNVDEPHVLFATTVRFPPVALAVVLILVVIEVPVQPNGKLHV